MGAAVFCGLRMGGQCEPRRMNKCFLALSLPRTSHPLGQSVSQADTREHFLSRSSMVLIKT
jgi:hypothetical protein